MRYALVLLALSAACSDFKMQREAEAKRRAEFQKSVAPDSGVATPEPKFEAPDDWETVRLAMGGYFRQPEGFTFGLRGAVLGCDYAPPADSAVLPKDIAMPFPMTLTTRKGQIGEIAYANGFTIDSTDIAEHGSKETPAMRRGEGFLLLSGRRMVFGATRHPHGCMIIWAARGVQVNPDTMALVMSTVRFGAPPAAKPDSSF